MVDDFFVDSVGQFSGFAEFAVRQDFKESVELASWCAFDESELNFPSTGEVVEGKLGEDVVKAERLDFGDFLSVLG